MKREKIYERENIDFDEKDRIGWKSDNRCCHCGKPIYFGYGATLDHFVPLHKGGTNRNINLIALCEDCNKTKDDKIMTLAYVPYLKDKYKKELGDYLESYIMSFEYIERNRIFACDEYMMQTIPYVNNANRKRLEAAQKLSVKYKIKYTTNDDFDKICDYYEKYLKKHNIIKTKDEIEASISFWMQFGCIYYIERNSEIYFMAAITVKHLDSPARYKEIPYSINMYLFPLYSNNAWRHVSRQLITNLPQYILDEQKLDVLPITACMLKEDKLTYPVLSDVTRTMPYKDDMGYCSVNYLSSEYPDKDGKIEKTHKFFKTFEEQDKKLIDYIKNYPDSTWNNMLYSLFSPKDIEEFDLFKQGTENYEKNKEKMRHQEVIDVSTTIEKVINSAKSEMNEKCNAG